MLPQLGFAEDASKEEEKYVKAGPDFLRAYAQYKRTICPTFSVRL